MRLPVLDVICQGKSFLISCACNQTRTLYCCKRNYSLPKNFWLAPTESTRFCYCIHCSEINGFPSPIGGSSHNDKLALQGNDKKNANDQFTKVLFLFHMLNKIILLNTILLQKPCTIVDHRQQKVTKYIFFSLHFLFTRTLLT